MRETRFLKQVLALWLCILFVAVKSGNCFEPSSAADGGSAEDDALIQSLDAAVAQWLHDVEFVCNYRYSYAHAATAEDGLAGKFGVEIKGEGISGVFNKALGKMRVSRNHEHEPVITSQSERTTNVAYSDVEELANATTALSYNPVLNPANPQGSAVFSPRDIGLHSSTDGDGVKYGAGLLSLRCISPLSFSGEEPGRSLKATLGATSVSRSVVSSTPETVVVEVLFDYSGWRHRRRVEFSLQWSTPVIVAESLTQTRAGVTLESHSRAFDFVKLPGGPVSRRVVCATRTPNGPHPEFPWHVKVWVSDDLGTREPTEDDFLVPIVPNTMILGLEQPETALRNGKLDIDLASAGGLIEPYHGPPGRGAPAASKEEAPRSARGPWLAGAGLVACMGLLLAVWLRRKARSSAKGIYRG